MRATLYAKLVLVSLVAIVAAVGFLRLAAGPVSLQSYSDRLAHALADQLGQGWSVALADTALELNGSKPAVRTRELEIRNPAGLLVVRAPDAIVSLDPTSLLWGGLLPREIELRDLELRAAIAADGSLSFLPPPDAGGATPGPAPQPVPPPPGPAKPPLVAPGASPIAAAVASLLAPVLDDTGLIAAIDKARVVGARLSLVGADGRERVAFRNVGAEFEHREGGQRSITLDMAGQHGAWRLEGLVGEVDGRRSADLEVTSVPAEDILLLSGLSTLPAGSDVKVSAAVSATMEAGQLTRLSGSFDTAAGIVHQTGAPPVRLDQLAGRAIWHEDSREVELKDLAIVSGGTSVRVDGRLAAIEDGAWRLQLAGRDARFDGAAAGDPAFTLAELSTDMVFRDAAVSIERVVVKGDGIDARLWGGSRPDPRGPALTARIEADRSDLRKLLRLWPDTLNPDLRTYLVKNLTAGTVDQLRLAIDADPDDVRAMTSNRPLRDQALTATFSLSDAKLQVVDGLPPLKRLEAEGRTTGTRIALT
ncbi:MAG: hypothetical protein JO048_08165, partial [Methylobacteriaceae bacterium]|nr:hypothetical protein [Methylobacteriaceae bacterium]